MSEWLHAPSVEYLVSLVVATVAALAGALFSRGVQRRWAIACSLSLCVAAALATSAQRDLWLVQYRWDAWRRDAAFDGLASLHRALDAAATSTADAAAQALATPADRADAFDALAPLANGGDEHGVVVYRGDSAFAWAGTIRPPVDLTHDGTSVIATPFYLALQVLQRRGDVVVASVALLGAAPPADKLAAPLANRIASASGLSGFQFGPPLDSAPSPDVLHYSAGGRELFDVRAAPLAQGEVAQRIAERARARAGLAFVIALLCFIIGVWRGTRLLTQRVAALAVGLACTALVPLNEYSNLTRLFDPALYFTPKGGPLTGNAGALVTTSALVLLGVLAVFRRRAQRISMWGAITTILLVAILGPFLLRELARGVQVPAHGVDASLWLIWEIPLFLAAVSVLLAGAAAGATVLGARRGLWPWVGPTLALVAAVVAPAVWEAPGRWPWWYTLLWTAAIVLLAMSRRSRYVILAASIVAAAGATTLVWGRTARGRVEAAEHDLAGLSQVDSTAMLLLQRFGTSLVFDLAPTTRESLLRHYVVSDVASAGNPIALFAWPTDSGPAATFATADVPIPRSDVARIVARSRQTGMVIVEPVPSDTAMEVVMAAPSPTGGVTAAVLAPRSRLFEIDPFARLVGLEVDPEIEPPYTVRLREGAPHGALTTQPSWRREGSQLHGDWIVHAGKADAPVHVEVELRPLYALVQRGALIVFLDLALVGVLWFASVIADGGAGRWIRARRRTWGRSYRARLSLALLLFFIVPASAFAIWSYEQLATDATQSRALLVNETLRAIAPPPAAPLWLQAESDRLDTPLFLYRAGELAETSDPLYDELAPIGRYLRPPVELALGLRDEETDAQLEAVADNDARCSVIARSRRVHRRPQSLQLRRAPTSSHSAAVAAISACWCCSQRPSACSQRSG